MKKFLKKNKFIILGIILALIITLSFFSTVFGTTYENLDFKYGKVNAKCLNVRCGPGLTYNKVGKLYKGEYINVFAKVGGWYIVQTKSDLIGAVSSEYIDAVYNEEEGVSGLSTSEVNPEQNTESKSEETELQKVTSAKSSEVGAAEFADSNELSSDEKEFLELINSNRKNNGLEELQIDSEIQNIARLKAQDLKENNYFSHTSETYGNIDNMLATFKIPYEVSAENIAGNKTLSGAVEAWMNSNNHKINILNKDFNYTGIAVVDSETYGKIFVEVFVKK